MKNDRIGSDLKNELSRIKMSPELQSQILYAVAREKRRRPFFSGAAFAAAAVVIVAISAAGLALMQRGETPDNVTSPGGNISPAGTTSPAATYMNTPVPEHAPDKRADLSGMWINGEDNMFHLYKACAEMNGCTAYISDNAENEALSPCPECFCDCLWIDNATDMFHEDYDCPMLNDPYPVNMGILAKTDYVSCSECAGETASEVIETAPAIAPENIEPTSALSTPEPTKPASQDPSPKVVYRHSENGTEVILTGWAAQNMRVNWALTPKRREMVFTGSAVETDENGEIASPDTLEDPNLDYCWCTENGQFIHSVGDCSNMKNSFLALISPALGFSDNKEACPDCKDGLGNVYFTENGMYFHSDKNCSAMKNTASNTRRAAYAAGKSPCPSCLKYESENPAE